MEITKLLFDSTENIVYGIAPIAAAAIAAAPGIIKSVGSMFGGGKRRREERRAAAELGRRKQAYESFQFQNPYANMQNTYEDLTVNTQAADFAAQQQQQALASTMSGLQGAAGSSGIAALAQSLAQQQSANLQASSASIAQQEAQIKQAQAGEAARLQGLQAKGALEKQQFELGRTETLLDMAAQRKMRATAARAQAKQDLVGGLAEAVGAGGAAFMDAKGGGSGIPKGGVSGGSIPTGLGTSTMPNYGQSFLDSTSGMDLTIPKLV